MFDTANIVNVIDSSVAIKSILFNHFAKEFRERYPYAPYKYEDRLLKALDEVLIDNFISNLDWKIPVETE